ncbi:MULTISPECIES: hypothetical protein [Yersinia]|uniref:DUF7424 family protein n=1 Tax=Yersinia TaxID=629 RepID=UPI000EB20203|nr:hypothetical protein [Yersinia sp. IP36721]
MTKKIIAGFAIAASVLVLSGCKIDMGASIPLSGLLGSELKEGSADLYVEVPACNSYEDSRQSSKGLVDAKNEIAKIIPESEFKECFKKKFNSFALFSVPIAYGPEKLVSKDTNQIRILQSEDNFSFVVFGSKLREKLDQVKNKPSISGGFNPSDVSITLSIKNDTGKAIQATFASVYAGGKPVIYAPNVKMESGQEWPIRLSNVTTSSLFGSDGVAAWFMSDIKQ